MMAKLIPSRRKIVVSSLRCRMRATDCTMGECRNACSCSSWDLGAGVAVLAGGGVGGGGKEPATTENRRDQEESQQAGRTAHCGEGEFQREPPAVAGRTARTARPA